MQPFNSDLDWKGFMEIVAIYSFSIYAPNVAKVEEF
jgi:hypothetical protein